MTHQDLLILGGGPGGYAAAFRAAELGLSVTLIEKDKLGGTCLHRGCIPTKALLHAAEVAENARNGESVGVKTSFDGIDMGTVAEYKDGIVTRLYKGLQGLANAHRVNLIAGAGTFLGDNTVAVDGVRYTGRHTILATGSHPRSLPGLEISGHVVVSDQALSLDYVPRRVIVLGGGVIGVEFASLWASFGAHVTIIEALPRLLPEEDEFASKLLEWAFRRRKIASKTGVKFADVVQNGAGVVVSLETGESLDADLLLVAVGRAPNTTGHGFERAGVATERGFVTVDDRLRTSLSSTYAIGDIVAGPQLAHRGFAHGIFVAEDIAGLGPYSIDDAGIPRVAYSHPEVASVGLTENKAKAIYGRAVTTLSYDLGGNGKSQILKTSGAIKLVQAPGGAVVGIHMVGDRVSELIGEAQLIYHWRTDPGEVASLIHAHPTQNESLGEAMLALAGKPLHTHI